MLSDKEIKALISNGVLLHASDKGVGPVAYDLTTESFHSNDGPMSEVELKPGESIYVAAKEVIALPNNLTARVFLKNSRIRQGLTLDAPVYFPGHKTRVYYRVTNVSSDVIALDSLKGIAQIAFEPVDGTVEQPYAGAFSDEFDYRGMADYSDMYRDDMRKLDSKVDEVKGIERRMYGNVLALMAIFAAIFTLVNINVNAFQAESGLSLVLVANLATVGSFAFLSGIIAMLVKPEVQKTYKLLWAVAVVAFMAAGLLAFLG